MDISQHTCLLSLFTRASNPSRETFAGILTAGASCRPSSSETNWTTMLGVGSGASFSGSWTPWYIFWRLGGGSKVAIVVGELELKNKIPKQILRSRWSAQPHLVGTLDLKPISETFHSQTLSISSISTIMADIEHAFEDAEQLFRSAYALSDPSPELLNLITSHRTCYKRSFGVLL